MSVITSSPNVLLCPLHQYPTVSHDVSNVAAVHAAGIFITVIAIAIYIC